MSKPKDLTALTEKGIQCPAFTLPASPLLDDETHRALEQHRLYVNDLIRERTEATEKGKALPSEQQRFYQGVVYKDLKNRYKVNVSIEKIAGVEVEVFDPIGGISDKNQHRVLINLHGGAFCWGSRTHSQLESIPVAALGKIKVISVDYRMAPEHRFPAATDDVETVYRALLKDYPSENIGIYGASSGAQLVAMTLVRLQEQQLPPPAAVAMIAGGATRVVGDSVAFIAPMMLATTGFDLKAFKREYFAETDPKDPSVTPAQSDSAMSAFPPSLLVSSTRDYMLSSVVSTHQQLRRLGVHADLHIFEGLEHTFHYNPKLPANEDLTTMIIDFFDPLLGSQPR